MPSPRTPGSTSRRRSWAWVSLRLTQKMHDLGYVQDLVDNRPLPGAEVQLFFEGRVAAAGRTDASGLFSAPVPSAEGGECRLVARQGDSYAFTQNYASEGGEENNYRVYFYTDRPVYRPGQTVHFKGIVRQRGTGHVVVDVIVQVEGSDHDDLGGSGGLGQPLRAQARGRLRGRLLPHLSAPTG